MEYPSLCRAQYVWVIRMADGGYGDSSACPIGTSTVRMVVTRGSFSELLSWILQALSYATSDT